MVLLPHQLPTGVELDVTGLNHFVRIAAAVGLDHGAPLQVPVAVSQVNLDDAPDLLVLGVAGRLEVEEDEVDALLAAVLLDERLHGVDGEGGGVDELEAAVRPEVLHALRDEGERGTLPDEPLVEGADLQEVLPHGLLLPRLLDEPSPAEGGVGAQGVGQLVALAEGAHVHPLRGQKPME